MDCPCKALSSAFPTGAASSPLDKERHLERYSTIEEVEVEVQAELSVSTMVVGSVIRVCQKYLLLYEDWNHAGGSPRGKFN